MCLIQAEGPNRIAFHAANQEARSAVVGIRDTEFKKNGYRTRTKFSKTINNVNRVKFIDSSYFCRQDNTIAN